MCSEASGHISSSAFGFFFFSSRRRHTRLQGDWSSDVCSSDLVAVLSRPDAGTTQAFLAIAACLAASFLYGLAGVYMKRWAGEVPARGMAVGPPVAAGLLMLPLIPVSPPPAGGTVPGAARVLAPR